jgi:uroporphyrinogen-III decarboxylase
VKGELPEGIRSPEAAAKRGRVGVALDVIRRLKSLVRDGSLLMAGVTGPFTLAARLTQFEEGDSLRSEHRPDDALEVAASLMMHLSAVYVEAGANLVFIQEEVLPRLSSESCEAWAERLAPAFNLIRFYQALPVLHLTGHRSFAENSEVILQQPWNCLVCPTLDVTSSRATQIFRSGDMIVGIALPLEVLQPDKTSDEDLDRFLHHTMSELRPAILTTAGDVPAGTDLKRLKRVSAFCR